LIESSPPAEEAAGLVQITVVVDDDGFSGSIPEARAVATTATAVVDGDVGMTPQQRGQMTIMEAPVEGGTRIPLTTEAYLKAQNTFEQPHRVHVEHDDEHCLSLCSIGMWEPGCWSMAVFTCTWNGFLLVVAFAVSAFYIIFFPHCWIGIYLAIVLVRSRFNRIIVTVTSDNEIMVKETGPIKICTACSSGQDKILSLAEDTCEVCSKRHVKQGKNGPCISYDVHLVKSDNNQTMILDGVLSMEIALYVQQEIQSFLLDKETPHRRQLRRKLLLRQKWSSVLATRMVKLGSGDASAHSTAVACANNRNLNFV
jgi:hypothetical protein